MADVKWIKITTDIFDDEKILLIESLPDSYAIITVWFKLLCLAGKQNNSGVFMLGRMPYTEGMLATIFRMKETTVTMALKTFENFGMIEIVDGVITIPNWGKHQSLDQLESKKEYMRNYMKEYREKQKVLTEGKPLCKTNSKTNVSSAEKDIEKEEELEKEKEYHSFIHSIASEEEAYIEKKVAEAGFDNEEDAETYKSEIKDGLRLKYLGGTLGQGVVLMSDEQFGDLCDKLSIEELDKYMSIIVECEKNGKRYKKKSHYQAILEMVAKDRKI